MIGLTSCVLLLCICNGITLSVAKIQVQTSQGPVRGKLVHDKTTNVSYYSYEGIPYAEPPVGCLRFKPPVKKQAWRTVFDATKPGLVCPQREEFYSKKQMSEDCLTYNVYVPARRSNKLLPVFFHVHDGNFETQSGNAEPIYGPQIFLMRDMVMVTVNFRIGALGFLSLCNEEISGNAGVKDVLLALKIVHENIAKFGGDPNKIMLHGKGSGTAIVQMLMLTEKSAGLYHNAIHQSGSILSEKYLEVRPRQKAMSLARELDLDYSNEECFVEGLKNVDPFDLVKAQEAMRQKDPRRGFCDTSSFKPTVEVDHREAILTKSPLKLMKEGSISDVPIIVIIDDQEGLEVFTTLREEPDIIDRFNDNMELLLPEGLEYPKESEERQSLLARMKDFYFEGKEIRSIEDQNYINLVSDLQYVYPIDLFVRTFTAKNRSPVYYCLFGEDSGMNWFKTLNNISYPGVAHADEIGYVYVTSVTKSKYKNLDPKIKKVQDNLTKLVESFMNTGKPPSDVDWPEAGQEDIYHLSASQGEFKAVYETPFTNRTMFWRKVYQEYFDCNKHYGHYFCNDYDIMSVQ